MAEGNTTTKIVACACQHPWQDATYGNGQRVANYAPKAKNGKWRCTVCGKEHEK